MAERAYRRPPWWLRAVGKMPQVAASFQQLPDPADHPTFRITAPDQ
jgi:hypothetical protein